MSNAAGNEKWNTGTSSDDAFSGVQASHYWSSTTAVNGATDAWYVTLFNGIVSTYDKTITYYVWPLRGGQ